MVIPIKEMPRLPRLVHDYFYDYGRVSGFFSGDFRFAGAFDDQMERVAARRLPREPLAAILAEQNRRYGCGPQTLANIRTIARNSAFVVVTGQQVGLFSGPLYTIYKAMTAVKLAERLSARERKPVVPVFWLASDDHDLAEIDHIALVDKDNRLEKIRSEVPGGEAKIPASDVLLPADVGECLRRLGELTADSEFKAEVLEQLGAAYRPGRSFVDAFAAWMTRLFGSRGLVFIDATDPGLKALGAEIFRREIAEDSPSTREGLTASGRLQSAGYEEQVHLHEGILNVFFVEKERRTIHHTAGAYAVKETGRVFAKEEILALAGEKPSLFSPNVLLRALYQDALLPTVAYVGGPGEIAYLAQTKGIYDAFGLPMPVIYPRKTMTLVERKIDHILAKFGLSVTEIWRRADQIVSETARKQIPEALSAALADAGVHLGFDFDAIRREVAAFEPTLKESADLAQGKMIQQLKYLETKVNRAFARHGEIEARQLNKAIVHLYPGHNLQERMLNIVPFFIKYGYGLLAELERVMDMDEYDHQVVSLG